MHFARRCTGAVRQNTPCTPARKAEIILPGSEKSSNKMTRVSGDSERTSRMSSEPAALGSSRCALITATAGFSFFTRRSSALRSDGDSIISNCPFRPRASTNNCVVIEVLSAAKTRRRSSLGMAVIWVIDLLLAEQACLQITTEDLKTVLPDYGKLDSR